MPEHLEARTTISRDMFYYILASKLPSKKNNNKNLPPDHKISEKKDANQLSLFTWPYVHVEQEALLKPDSCLLVIVLFFKNSYT